VSVGQQACTSWQSRQRWWIVWSVGELESWLIGGLIGGLFDLGVIGQQQVCGYLRVASFEAGIAVCINKHKYKLIRG